MNPYGTEIETIQSGNDLFGSYRLLPKKKQTERGLLLSYFSQKTGWSIPRIGPKVQGMDVQTLYFLKSSADQYEAQGNPWGKGFFGTLKKCTPTIVCETSAD